MVHVSDKGTVEFKILAPAHHEAQSCTWCMCHLHTMRLNPVLGAGGAN